MIDLHSHSTASDGQYTPSELIKKAISNSISVLALTDHDTVAGNEEAKLAANNENITFIPGIEIQILWPTGEFHLLGLGIKQVSKKLQDIIDYLQNARKNRNLKMVEKFDSIGIHTSLEEIQSLSNTQTVGRPHFADLLVQRKIVKNRQQAFDKYLGRGRKCYVSRAGADLKESVDAILASGAIPVIAHPLSLYVSWGKLEDTLKEIYNSGVQGLEAYHPGIKLGEAVRLEALARKLGFFITAGSDFHGEKLRSDRHLGYTAGDKKIDDKYWTDELKPQLKDFC